MQLNILCAAAGKWLIQKHQYTCHIFSAILWQKLCLQRHAV